MLHIFSHLERCVDPLDVHCFLCTVVSSDNAFEQKTRSNYNHIFHSDIWTYDQLFPINCVAEKFLCETDVNKCIETYSSELVTFRKCTRIVDINERCCDLAAKALHEPRKIVNVYRRVWQRRQIKIDVTGTISSLHLSYIDEISSQLSDKFVISDGHSLLKIKEVTNRELVLDWLISNRAIDCLDILSVDKINFLKENRFVRISHVTDDGCITIFDCDKVKFLANITDISA